MIKEVVGTIIEAENKAEEIIAAANAEAKQIMLDCDSEIEKLRSEFSAHRKNSLKTAAQTAGKEGDAKASEIIAAGDAECAEIAKSAEGRMEAATDFVIKRLVI